MKACGSLATRLGRLEERTAAHAPAEPEHRDAAGWLAALELFEREGYADAEPDFPTARAGLRDALARTPGIDGPRIAPKPPVGRRSRSTGSAPTGCVSIW